MKKILNKKLPFKVRRSRYLVRNLILLINWLIQKPIFLCQRLCFCSLINNKLLGIFNKDWKVRKRYGKNNNRINMFNKYKGSNVKLLNSKINYLKCKCNNKCSRINNLYLNNHSRNNPNRKVKGICNNTCNLIFTIIIVMIVVLRKQCMLCRKIRLLTCIVTM